MHSTTKFLFAAALLSLAACSTPPTGQDLPAPAAGPVLAGENDEHSPTGSRLKKGNNGRILKAMGQQDMRNALDSQPRPLAAQ